MPDLEKDKSDWGFKGLKQAIKLEFGLGQYGQVRDGLAALFLLHPGLRNQNRLKG